MRSVDMCVTSVLDNRFAYACFLTLSIVGNDTDFIVQEAVTHLATWLSPN